MRRILLLAVAAFSLSWMLPAPAVLAGDAPGMQRLGIGVNYWKKIDEIDDSAIDEDGFSFLASYQVAPTWFFKVEFDLELFPDLAGGPEAVLAPELFVTFGGLFYGGAGIGIYLHDGDWGDAPFYMLRAGLDFPIAPRVFLDVNANYRFNDWDSLSDGDVDTDTVRLGAALRFVL
jgi:opacity protein-like surface antigen